MIHLRKLVAGLIISFPAMGANAQADVNLQVADIRPGISGPIAKIFAALGKGEKAAVEDMSSAVEAARNSLTPPQKGAKIILVDKSGKNAAILNAEKGTLAIVSVAIEGNQIIATSPEAIYSIGDQSGGNSNAISYEAAATLTQLSRRIEQYAMEPPFPVTKDNSVTLDNADASTGNAIAAILNAGKAESMMTVATKTKPPLQR